MPREPALGGRDGESRWFILPLGCCPLGGSGSLLGVHGLRVLILTSAALPLEAVVLKHQLMANALRAEVAFVFLGFRCPQNLAWQFPLFCQFFSALKLVIF